MIFWLRFPFKGAFSEGRGTKHKRAGLPRCARPLTFFCEDLLFGGLLIIKRVAGKRLWLFIFWRRAGILVPRKKLGGLCL